MQLMLSERRMNTRTDLLTLLDNRADKDQRPRRTLRFFRTATAVQSHTGHTGHSVRQTYSQARQSEDSLANSCPDYSSLIKNPCKLLPSNPPAGPRHVDGSALVAVESRRRGVLEHASTPSVRTLSPSSPSTHAWRDRSGRTPPRVS